MQIVERYLHAIEFWLPKEHSHDIIAEISEDIHSQIEERQEQLGRRLSEAELETLIKQRGRPVLVANRYLPQRFLIGPLLFPIYLFVLKMFAFCYAIPSAAVFVAVRHLQHPEIRWSGTILAALGSASLPAFLGAGVITIVFAVLQMFESQAGFLKDWNPRHLRPARNPNRIPRASSTMELVVYVAVAVWWTTHASSLNLLNGPSVRVSLWPVWMRFFWGFLVVALLNTALSAMNLVRPYWTGVRALFRLMIDGAGSVLFCWLLKTDVIAALDIAGIGPSRGLEIRSAIRVWSERAFPFAILAVAVILAADIYRVIRVNKKGAGLIREVLAMLLLAALAVSAHGQQMPATPGAKWPLPSDVEIRRMLADRIDVQRKSVGMIVAIVDSQGRRIVSYGQADGNGSSPLTGDTVFEIGSVTKIFTTLLLADMAQRREVALTDPVAKYLSPGITIPERQGRLITLADLATHTSGLPFLPSDIPLDDPQAAQRSVADYRPAQLYEFLAKYQLTREIGAKWEYSNLGFGLLGQALARRAGTDYETLVHARITGPLGMRRTSIALSPDMRSRLAAGHDANLRPAPEGRMAAFLGAGGLRSTANDLLTFLEAFLGYRKSTLAPAMDGMFTTRRPGPGFDQALGWWVVSTGPADQGFAFHAGQTAGYSSSVAFDRHSGAGVVVLSNSEENDGGLAWHLMRANIPLRDSASEKSLADKAKNELPIDPEVLDFYAGRYRVDAGPSAGQVITIERTGDFLVMKSSTTPANGFRLRAQDEHVFFITEADLELGFAGDRGRPATKIEIRFAGAKVVASRIPNDE